MHALGHVDERAARPRGRVQRAELVIIRRYDRAEVLAHQIRVFAHRGVGVHEDHALVLQLLLDGVVDDLGLVLGGHAGDQTLLLRLGDAQTVVGVPDVVRQILPGGGLLVDRLDVVLEVVGVEAAQVHAPIRHWFVQERLIALETDVEHPLGFALVGGDGAHHVLVDALLRRLAGRIRIMPAVLVFAELADDFVILPDLVLVDAGPAGHVLAHLHVSRGAARLPGRLWRHLVRHCALPPSYELLPSATLMESAGKH